VVQLPPALRRAVVTGALVALGTLGLATPGGATPSSYGTGNLLAGDSAALSQSVGSWQGRYSTVSVSSPGVLAMTSTSTSWMAAVTGTGGTPAVPNGVYSGSISVRSASQSEKVAPSLLFYDATGKMITSVQGQVIKDASSYWTAAEPVVAVAPAGTASVVLGEIVGTAPVGEVHYLRQPVLTMAPDLRRDLVGPLHTSGNQVYDANGPVILRGINRRGLEKTYPVPFTAAEMAQAKLWGATMVRVPVSSAYWMSGNCNYDANYVASVDQAVQAVTAQHMVALVDLHTNTPLSCGIVKQQAMADSTAPKFWRQVAARYGTNPLVAFDLYNEPHDITDDVWLHGGRAISGGVAYQAVGMQDMYDAVRSTGAQNLVFVSGNNWANTLPAQLVSGSNIVYAAHVYTCPTSTDPAKCSPGDPLDPTPILRNFVTASASVPVVVTEFGWPSPTDGRYAENVIAFAAQHGWGWLIFGWDGRTTGDFSLLSQRVVTYEPTPAGMPALGVLRYS
jgi:hypothetical protein